MFCDYISNGTLSKETRNAIIHRRYNGTVKQILCLLTIGSLGANRVERFAALDFVLRASYT